MKAKLPSRGMSPFINPDLMFDHSTEHEQPCTLPHWKLHDRLSRFPKFWDSGFLNAEILGFRHLPEFANA